MDDQTAPTAPSTPPLPAPNPAQTPSAKPSAMPPAVPGRPVQAAPHAPAPCPTPPRTAPSAPPARPLQAPAPPPKPTVPIPPARPAQPTQAAPTAIATHAPGRQEDTTVCPTTGDETTGESDASEEETVVTRQIINLWADREKKKKNSLVKTKASLNISKASIKTTKEQLSLMRAELGKRFFELKNLLAKPGRKGRWASFLDGEGIPRATADRYVQSHKRSLEGNNGKRLTEAISVPTEVKIKTMVAKLMPRLVRALPTPDSIAQFLREMTAALQSSGSAGVTLPQQRPIDIDGPLVPFIPATPAE